MMQKQNRPDMDQAAKFLEKLDPKATSWTFQTFDDSKLKNPSLARVLHGTLEEHGATLADLQARGAGVFVTVNQTDDKGRKAENVTRVRAFFLDLDGAPLDPVTAWEEPHILCETSPGRYHTFWLVDDCPLDAFRQVQKDLIETFGGDDCIHDLPRVMRLPGFWHMKGDPYMVRMIDSGASPATICLHDFKSKISAVKPAPKLSHQAMPPHAPIKTGQGWADTALRDELSNLRATSEGQRNDALNKAAFNLGQIVAGGALDQADVRARLTAAAGGIGLCANEIAATIQSGLAAGLQTPRGPKEKANQIIAQTQIRPAAMFHFVPVHDLKYREPDYIIDELFETETLGLLFGDPGCGKSFLAVDIALAVASGTPFHGRHVKQGSVFFIAGEGHNGLARRFAAWAKARDVSLAGVPLFKSERAAQFLDGASAKAVADAVASLAKDHGQPTLIIIDTLARNFGAGDENNTKDMSEFVVAVDDLKARFPGCAVLIVHHSGHAEKQRARGAMALKGALDLEFRVEKDGDAMRLINTKMKDAEPPSDMFFSFRQVDLDGSAKSAVLDATDAPERTERLTATQRIAHTAYVTAAKQSGEWADDGFLGVHADAWREAFYSIHTGDNADAKKKAFQRVRRDLVEKGMMAVKDDVYLIKDIGVKMAISLERDKRDTAGQNEKCPDAEAGLGGTNGTNA